LQKLQSKLTAIRNDDKLDVDNMIHRNTASNKTNRTNWLQIWYMSTKSTEKVTVQWVTLSLVNTKDLYQSLTPN